MPLLAEGTPTVAGTAPVDLGFWAGSIVYAAPYGTIAIPLGGFDVNGVAWILNKVEGWDSPDTAGQVIQRSADHGGWAASQYYAPRVITLTITASAPSQALRDTARAMLQQAVPVNGLATFTYREPVPKQAMVRRSGRVIESCPTLTDAQFSVVLAAPDPRKYGTSLKTASTNAAPPPAGIAMPFPLPFTFGSAPLTGSVTCVNAGSFETRPVLTLTGPMTAPSFTNVTTGQTVSFSSLTLASTDVLSLDMDSKQAALNGQFRPADPRSSWWVMQPSIPGIPGSGSTVIQLGGSSPGGAALTVQWRDAWI